MPTFPVPSLLGTQKGVSHHLHRVEAATGREAMGVARRVLSESVCPTILSEVDLTDTAPTWRVFWVEPRKWDCDWDRVAAVNETEAAAASLKLHPGSYGALFVAPGESWTDLVNRAAVLK